MRSTTSDSAPSLATGERLAGWATNGLGLALLGLGATLLALPWAVPGWVPRALELEPLALPWLRALQACSAGFSLVLVMSALLRLRAGASPAELVRTRFEEVTPLRGLVHLVHAWIWIALLGSIAAVARAGYAIYRVHEQSQSFRTVDIVLAIALVALVFALAWLRKRYRAAFVELPKFVAIRVEVSLTAISDGIASGELAGLGAERFPNRIRGTWWLGLCVRAGMLVVLWSGAAAIAWLAFFELEHATFLAPGVPLFHAALAWILELSSSLAPWREYAFVLGYGAVVIAFIALTRNRNYLLFSFGAQQLVHVTVTVLLVLCAALIAGETQVVVLTAIAALSVWGLRMASDLNLARKHTAQRRAESPMRTQLGTQGALLRGVLADPACHLPEINVGDIERRITQGAENLGEADPFVTRHFGRYLRVGRVRKERCAMALLRYMTVDRHVGLAGGWPTCKALGGPSVPLWDETQFPLNVPAGFVTWLDGLRLSEDWDVVKLCGRCGGCGWVMETEYYTETEHYTEYVNGQSRSATRQVQRSRQVRRTCSTCNGCGRLEYGQVLYTQWRAMRPSSVHPFVPLPELVDGAEEVCLVRVALTENRQDVARRVQSAAFQPGLMREVEATADAVRAAHPELAQRALAHLGGHLYRAEYSIWAFHTLQIRFALLARRVGWFFGQRPEFYFPKLPFSWSCLGTTLFLPPLFVASVAAAALGAWAAVTSIVVP
jgi:hypothetical protein